MSSSRMVRRSRLSAGTFRAAAGDLSATPHYLIEGPLGRWASMLAEGRPVEFWSVTQATREAWGLGRDRGRSDGYAADDGIGILGKRCSIDGERQALEQRRYQRRARPGLEAVQARDG